jgi:hypothetical protein
VWGGGKHDTIVRVRLASVGEMGSAVLRDARKKPPTGAGRKKGCVCVGVCAFPREILVLFFLVLLSQLNSSYMGRVIRAKLLQMHSNGRFSP